MTSRPLSARRLGRGAFALAFVIGIAGFGSSAAAMAASARAGASFDARSSGLIVLAKNDDRDGRNWNRRGRGNNGNKNWGNNEGWDGDGWERNDNGHRNWSKNDNGWGGNGYKNWNKKNGNKYGKGWGGYDRGWEGNWNRGYVQEWGRKPHYGELIGGIILGSLLAANGIGVAPPYPPAPGLCWYWADPFMYRGYWDYCD